MYLLEFLEKEQETIDGTNEAVLVAYERTMKILIQRYAKELKQYNQNEEKAFDYYISKKNLDYLDLYIEEFMLIGVKENALFFLKVQKQMRSILHHLHNHLNKANTH